MNLGPTNLAWVLWLFIVVPVVKTLFKKVIVNNYCYAAALLNTL